MRIAIWWEQSSWGGVDKHLVDLILNWPCDSDFFYIFSNDSNEGLHRINSQLLNIKNLQIIRFKRKLIFTNYFAKIFAYLFLPLRFILYFIENAKITLRAASSEKNFLGAYPFVYNQVPADGLNNGVYTPPDTTYSNWQFPFIAQGGITIEASGKASISINANNDSINFVNPVSPPNSYPITSRAGLLAAANVTLQDTGVFTPGSGSFQVWLANADSAPIQMIPNALTITNAIITKKNASFTPQMMEVDFSLLAYV